LNWRERENGNGTGVEYKKAMLTQDKIKYSFTNVNIDGTVQTMRWDV